MYIYKKDFKKYIGQYIKHCVILMCKVFIPAEDCVTFVGHRGLQMGGESKLCSLNKENAHTLRSSHKIEISQKNDMYCFKVSSCGPMLTDLFKVILGL